MLSLEFIGDLVLFELAIACITSPLNTSFSAVRRIEARVAIDSPLTDTGHSGYIVEFRGISGLRVYQTLSLPPDCRADERDAISKVVKGLWHSDFSLRSSHGPARSGRSLFAKLEAGLRPPVPTRRLRRASPAGRNHN